MTRDGAQRYIIDCKQTERLSATHELYGSVYVEGLHQQISMSFNGPRRQAKFMSDLFCRLTFCDQYQDRMLPFRKVLRYYSSTQMCCGEGWGEVRMTIQYGLEREQEIAACIGLKHVSIGASAHCGRDDRGLRVHGKAHERDARALRSKRLQRLEPAHAWHRYVGDDDVDLGTYGRLHQRFAVFVDVDDIKGVSDDPSNALGYDPVIVGKENARTP